MYKIYLTIRSYTRDLYITYFESKHSRKLALYDIFRNFLSILNISKNYSEKLKKKIFDQCIRILRTIRSWYSPRLCFKVISTEFSFDISN